MFPHTLEIQYHNKNLGFSIFEHNIKPDHYAAISTDMMSVHGVGFGWQEALQESLVMTETILVGKISKHIQKDLIKYGEKLIPLVCEPLFTYEFHSNIYPEKITVHYPDFFCTVLIVRDFLTKKFFADCKEEEIILGYENSWFNAFSYIMEQIEAKHRDSKESHSG